MANEEKDTSTREDSEYWGYQKNKQAGVDVDKKPKKIKDDDAWDYQKRKQAGLD